MLLESIGNSDKLSNKGINTLVNINGRNLLTLKKIKLLKIIYGALSTRNMQIKMSYSEPNYHEDWTTLLLLE